MEAIVRVGDEDRTVWGVGIAPSITTASLRAVVSAVNRANGSRRVAAEAVGEASTRTWAP